MTLVYSLDTSSLIDAWDVYYPPENFPTLWRRFDDLIGTGRARAASEVRTEIERLHDGLTDWSAKHAEMFCEIDRPLSDAKPAVMRDYPRLVDTITGRSGGDPWVIALAQVHGCIVVSEEKPAKRKMRIPDVCRELGLPCIRITDLVKHEGWRF